MEKNTEKSKWHKESLTQKVTDTKSHWHKESQTQKSQTQRVTDTKIQWHKSHWHKVLVESVKWCIFFSILWAKLFQFHQYFLCQIIPISLVFFASSRPNSFNIFSVESSQFIQHFSRRIIPNSFNIFKANHPYFFSIFASRHPNFYSVFTSTI